MTQTLEALYENGVLKPLQPLKGVEEHSRVRLILELDDLSHPLAACVGILPDEDATEMQRIIDEEFERIDPDEWR